MLFVADNGQCDSDHSKGAKQKYEPFFICTQILANIKTHSTKNFQDNNNFKNLKSTIMYWKLKKQIILF